MKITIEEIGKEQEEEMILRCHELNTDMRICSSPSRQPRTDW